MSKMKKWGLALIGTLLMGTTVNNIKAQVGVTVSFQTFYDDLSPYGQWVSDPQYGYVWVPDVQTDFRPYYTNGYWVMTDYGNTWVSDYPWGWAPFHYGRWTYDVFYGWVWIPGNEWGPAWVCWRSNADYYGWAPLGPGVSISFSGWMAPDDWWVFCPPRYVLYGRGYYRHCREPRYNSTIIHNTVIVNNTIVHNNTTYITGPRREEYEHVTHKQVPVYNIGNADKPGKTVVQKQEVNIYHPTFEKKDNNRPAHVTTQAHPLGEPKPMKANGGKPEFKSTPKTEQQHVKPTAPAPAPRGGFKHTNPQKLNEPVHVQPQQHKAEQYQPKPQPAPKPGHEKMQQPQQLQHVQPAPQPRSQPQHVQPTPLPRSQPQPRIEPKQNMQHTAPQTMPHGGGGKRAAPRDGHFKPR